MKKLLIIVCLVLVGCETKEIKVEDTTNTNFKAVLLGTISGCRIYRFEDFSTMYYMTKCDDVGTVSITR